MKHFDDLQILALIDECEAAGNPGPLLSGLELMKRMTVGQDVDWNQDAGPFARELLLARQAGFIDWEDRSGRDAAAADPLTNSHYWLQLVRDIRLTLTGRDRSRGRVVLLPLPDPDEDDGRLITGMTLEEVARALADTYTASQLPRFLADSGVPEEYLASHDSPDVRDRVAYVLGVLEALLDGGSDSRRAARLFIGGWLDGQHHVPPRDDVRNRITALLAQQGWHVREGRLVIGEKAYDAAGVLTPLGKDARIAALHPKIREVTRRLVEDGHTDAAVFEAFKAVNNRVKAQTESDLDGRALMTKAFAEKDPQIVLADQSTQSGKDTQEGFRFLFMGAVQGIRNPNAHDQFKDLSPEECLEALAFASLLMRRLDGARVAREAKLDDLLD